MIPKKIHFIWIGGGAVTSQAATFVLWWRKLMPDYQLVVWDKSRYETIADKPRYAEEAYAERKWAFVCDWLRAYVLYKEGGWRNVRGAQICAWLSSWHADVGWNDVALSKNAVHCIGQRSALHWRMKSTAWVIAPQCVFLWLGLGAFSLVGG